MGTLHVTNAHVMQQLEHRAHTLYALGSATSCEKGYDQLWRPLLLESEEISYMSLVGSSYINQRRKSKFNFRAKKTSLEHSRTEVAPVITDASAD